MDSRVATTTTGARCRQASIRSKSAWPAFKTALNATGVPHEMHKYPGTQHGFHNNYDAALGRARRQARLDRTIAHFMKYLA